MRHNSLERSEMSVEKLERLTFLLRIIKLNKRFHVYYKI